MFRLTPLGDIDDAFSPEPLAGFRFAASPDRSIFDELGTRYLPSGERDPRDEQSPVTVGVDLAVDVAAETDGKKLFLGLEDRTNYRRLAVQRFDADWQPDHTFGTNGIATAAVAPGKRRYSATQPELERVLPAPDGAVVAFGRAFGPKRSYAFAIKFNATGQLEEGFGDRGRLLLGPPSRSKEVYDIAAQPDGSLTAIGSSGRDRARMAFVARYTPDGKPIRGFGRAGRATLGVLRTRRRLDSRKLNRGNRLAAITAGRYGTTIGVVSLSGVNASVVKSLAFRLRANGTLDPSFGHNGVTLLRRLG